MKNPRLIREQLDQKIIKFSGLQNIVMPPNGWIFSIRQGINMSLRQLGNRLSISPQSVRAIETREKDGSVSLNVLRRVGNALEMDFVYGFVPHDQTLEKMIEKKATELATRIVERTSIQMALEDQKNTDKRLKKAINEKTGEIIRKLPRYLWD